MPLMPVGKLGKKAAVHSAKTLQLADYLTGVLPPFPDYVNWGAHARANWGMAGNDSLGDCTCAAACHAIQAWTANTGTEETIPDNAVLAAYSAITGWSPNIPDSDNGAVELDVLNYWRQNGIGGHKIGAFVATEPHNRDHVKAAVNLFGGLYIGIALPVSAQTQRVWSVPPGGFVGANAPGSWGGHAVFVVGYDSQGLKCITWGRQQRMTWGFWDGVCDEAYALLSDLWVTPGHVAPSGLDLASLQADLALL
jgi:hypothetical protein